MVNITDLPPELIKYIASQAEHDDAKSLRVTCRAFSELLAPLFLRRIVLALNQGGPEDEQQTCPEMLRTLVANNLHPARNLTREVIIKHIRPPPGVEGDALKTQLKSYLRPALESLKSIDTLRWKRPPTEEPWVTESVVEALIPILSRVRIVEFTNFDEGQILLLNGLTRLSSLSVSLSARVKTYGNDPIPLWTKNISTAVERSASTLLYLTLSRPSLYSEATYCILGIFKEPETWGTSQLKSLSFTGNSDYVYSTTPTLPHLLSLQTCHLILAGCSSGRTLPDGHWTFWTALKNTGVQLTSIICQHASPELVQYLASYDGVLEEFTIADCDQDERCETSETSAAELVTSVLPRLRLSLRTLNITPSCDGAWCFGPPIRHLLTESSWPQLRELGIGVYIEDSGEDRGRLRELIETVVRSPELKLLETLSVKTVIHSSAGRRVSFAASFLMRLSQMADGNASRSIRKFRFSDEEVQALSEAGKVPPKIIISKTTFHLSKVNGEWLYTD